MSGTVAESAPTPPTAAPMAGIPAVPGPDGQETSPQTSTFLGCSHRGGEQTSTLCAPAHTPGEWCGGPEAPADGYEEVLGGL